MLFPDRSSNNLPGEEGRGGLNDGSFENDRFDSLEIVVFKQSEISNQFDSTFVIAQGHCVKKKNGEENNDVKSHDGTARKPPVGSEH